MCGHIECICVSMPGLKETWKWKRKREREWEEEKKRGRAEWREREREEVEEEKLRGDWKIDQSKDKDTQIDEQRLLALLTK